MPVLSRFHIFLSLKINKENEGAFVRNLNKLALTLMIIFTSSVYAVPADWKGSLSYDTNLIQDFRRTGDSCDASQNGECIKEEEDNARFQSLTLKLSPEIIVNDGVTIFSELSTGSVRTTNLGSSTTADKNGGGSYYAQTTSSSLNVNQLYAELYADTALYRVGRFAKHYGLGAVLNRGGEATDRFFSGYEGIEMNLKLGSFYLTPMYAKIYSPNQATTGDGNPNGRYDAYETNIIAGYDNPNQALKFGVLYSVREVETQSQLYAAGESQNVTLIDVFISKTWERLKVGLEVPMVSGKIGNAYGTGDADFDSNAYIFESEYELSSKWKVGINAGYTKGDDGSTDSFEGFYLHPNYQIAEVMFRYNYHGFNDANAYNIYRSSIVNSTYAQFFAHYTSGEWTWRMALLWAKANEVAQDGDAFYNHDKGVLVNSANGDQSDELGYEADLAFDYQWNPSVKFTGFLGYHSVGEYYEFSGDGSDLDLNNVMSSGFRLGVTF